MGRKESLLEKLSRRVAVEKAIQKSNEVERAPEKAKIELIEEIKKLSEWKVIAGPAFITSGNVAAFGHVVTFERGWPPQKGNRTP